MPGPQGLLCALARVTRDKCQSLSALVIRRDMPIDVAASGTDPTTTRTLAHIQSVRVHASLRYLPVPGGAIEPEGTRAS